MAVQRRQFFRASLILVACASSMGCAFMHQHLYTASASADSRVVMCKGSGAYASCRSVDPAMYRDVMKGQGRMTGTRINPDPVTRRTRSSL
jgi:hypothetical protein